MRSNPRRLSLAILVIVALVSVFFAAQLPDIAFEHQLEAFFPANVKETEDFYEFRKAFGSDNDYLLIGIQHSGSLFDSAFLAKVDAFSGKLEEIPHIDWVLSPTRIRDLRRQALSPIPTGPPFLHIKDPDTFTADSLRIYGHPLLVNFLFSEDRQSLMIYAQNTPMPDAETCRLVADSIEQLLIQFDFHGHHTAGKCLGQTYYIRLIEREIILFTALAIAMIALFLWLSYRRLWAVWLPLLVVGLTVLWTTGIMILAGREIDIISHIIPTILLVIGIANLIHLLTHYLAIRRHAPDTLSALSQSIRQVGMATVMSTATTAFGFLTLSTSSFVPLEGLGIYSTIGLVIALVLSYTLAPAVLYFLPINVSEPNLRFSWRKPLEITFDWVHQYKKPIIIVSGIVLLGTAMIAPTLRINRYVLDDFRPSHPQRQHFAFFAKKFGGARSFELALHLRDSTSSFSDATVLEELEKVDTYLRNEYKVGNLISPLVALRLANQAYHFGRPRHYRLPQNPDETANLLDLAQQQPADLVPFQIFSADGKKARVNWQNRRFREPSDQTEKCSLHRISGKGDIACQVPAYRHTPFDRPQ